RELQRSREGCHAREIVLGSLCVFVIARGAGRGGDGEEADTKEGAETAEGARGKHGEPSSGCVPKAHIEPPVQNHSVKEKRGGAGAYVGGWRMIPGGSLQIRVKTKRCSVSTVSPEGWPTGPHGGGQYTPAP